MQWSVAILQDPLVNMQLNCSVLEHVNVYNVIQEIMDH